MEPETNSKNSKTVKKKNKGPKKKKSPTKLQLDPSIWTNGGKPPLTDYLSGLEEDIYPAATNHGSDVHASTGQPHKFTHISQPTAAADSTAQYFVEGRRRFAAKSTDRVAAEKALMRQRLEEAADKGVDSASCSSTIRAVSLLHVAISGHHLFLRVSRFCHGLLAGFALWQCVVLGVLYSANGDINGGASFIYGVYSRLCRPVNCVYAMLTSLTLWAALDDADVASTPRDGANVCCRFGISTTRAVIKTFLLPTLLLVLVMNNVLFAQDNKIGIMGSSMNGTNRVGPIELSTTTIWLHLNRVRGAAAIFSWCLVAVTAADREIVDEQIAKLQDREREILSERGELT